ncbi:Histidine kinase-, DNA gyrase B-, and HSP90-like ATPase [Actinacidiphila alni]|uniref:histidine kinase n=1 Tax=Actinacidiphila alni TaxID=380248 RepID=A0A1I2MGS3_9ACTN|nr:HAMP domain-containing sensor histidine kinase [Actinacidiphila alni]SFF90100.1 Histidine kinase-, DNA gyrase B-, and HSP90-like ATPase [Actinacidiphila alni]
MTRPGRRRTLGIHGRLFAGFAGALAVVAALMVAIIHIGIRYVPAYELGPAAGPPTEPPGRTPSVPAPPFPPPSTTPRPTPYPSPSPTALTPLATTRAVLQVAAREPGGSELAELTPMLVETNERNIAVVQALLELARAEHVPFDSAPVDLGRIARHGAAERTTAATERGITVEADTETGCAVGGNAALLGRLVANLLDNAITYNHPGGRMEIAVHRDSPHGEGVIVLEVENTGPQVDAETTERLFEPFYRQRSRIASDRAGHGLGLAIVHSIALAHHGTADARANPDGGLTVRVELPPATA